MLGRTLASAVDGGSGRAEAAACAQPEARLGGPWDGGRRYDESPVIDPGRQARGGGDAFARIAPHPVAIEIDPCIESTRQRNGDPQGDGLARYQRVERKNTVLVVEIGRKTRCRVFGE